MITNRNHCHFVGVVIGDAEVREFSNNRTSVSVRIRIVEHEIVEIVRIIAWGGLADHLKTYATKGTVISAHGRLHSTEHGCHVRLTEPVGLEVRKCLACREEFFVRDSGQRYCKPEHNPNPLAPGNKESQPANKQFAEQILTPKSW